MSFNGIQASTYCQTPPSTPFSIFWPVRVKSPLKGNVVYCANRN